ncbi:Retrovirus-related Pol polyprotein from transposon TNT 1-94 [Scenedesmus sp. PABB004]|nr:Retrovirus-related Pol polyprotein from transposon TNT 1-94 [Scenedesmus sp. PABB004]
MGNNAGLNVAWMATGDAPAPRDDREWFTDSGATQHMCCSREAFFELRPSGGVVHTTSGETIEIKGIGNIFITIPNERVFALFNVLYVPELAANLLSLVMMKGAATLIYSDDDTLPVLRAQRSANGVCSFTCDYVPSLENLKSLCYEPVSLLTLHDTESECRLWRARYGHAGCDRIARIARDDLAVNFPLSASTVKDYGASHICPTCAMVKSSERPFKPTGPNNFGPGELLHTDVGDTGVRSAGGSRYHVTLIDDATGFSFFVPLASKSYVTNFLKETIPLIMTATGNRVKVLRSDNGGEYNSTELHAYLATKGTSHQFTTPYSPASNGKAERLNRTLLESAVAMLKAAGLPKTVWAEAFHTANFLRNVLPADGKSKTPWELFFGTKPDASRLRVFGCRAYVHTPAALRTKLEPSAQPGVFLGYPSFGVSTTDGWRVRLDNGKFVTSRHVRFDESDLPGRARTTAGATDANLVSSPPSSPLVIGSGVPLLPAGNTGAGGSLSPPSSSGAAAGDAGDAGDAAGDPGDAGDTAGALCSSESGNLSSISSYSSASDTFVSVGDSFGDSGDSPGQAPSSSGHSPSSGGNAARLIPGQSQRQPVAPAERQPLVTAPRRSARIAARSAVPVQPLAIPGQLRADAFPVVEQPQSALLTTDTSGSSIVEPTSYDEAINSPQVADWIAAMAEELASLHANRTWELQTKPPGVKAIPCKWVFTLKRDAAGNIERFKARLVIKGFHQRAGIDYNDVFSPVIKYQTFRALMAAAAAHDWEVRHLDIKTAFLNGHLEEEVWMQQPPGFGEHGSALACRLRRSLYGLKQAPRVWNQRLHAELVAMGFAQTAADPCVYYLYKEGSFIILLVYVDDILVVTPRADLAAHFTARLLNAFEGRDLGPASCFLGMTIERNRAARTMKLCNPRLIYGLLERFDMGDVKPRRLPMQAGLHLSNTSGEPLNTEEFHYSALVGAAMYLATSLRPDIAHTASVLARFMAKPTTVHWQAAKGLLRYLAGTAELGINYSGGPAGLHLVGYTDADYAGCPDTRRSTSAFVFTMGGGAVSWCSQRQKTVSVSTAEAEYVAAAAAVKEALWLRNLLRELGSRNANTISIWADNQAAIKLLHNPISSARTKHIDVAYCFARERVVRGEVSFAYLPTADMVADVLTKGLPEVKHKACRTAEPPPEAVAAGGWEDCCVVDAAQAPRPAAGAQRAAAGAPGAAAPAEQPEMHSRARRWFLVGFWPGVRVDPSVWGLGHAATVMQFTVRGATLRLLQLRCAREVTPARGWTPGVGCVPGLWRAGYGQACPASAIARREAGRKRSWAVRQRAETPDPEPGLPAWQKVSPPRRHVMERVGPAAAAAAAARSEEQEQWREQQLEQRRTLVQELAANDLVDPLTGATAPARAGERAEPPAWAACYARAQQARMPRALRHFGWSLLHGGVRVSGDRVFSYQRAAPELAELACPHPLCRAQQQPPLETLGHVLGGCPVAAAVLQWFAHLWARLQPGFPRAPPPPRVMLADDFASGLPLGLGPCLVTHCNNNKKKKTHLRLLLLRALLAARARHGGGEPGHAPVAAIRIFVYSVRDAVVLDWRKAAMDVRALAGVPRSWLSGSGKELTQADFERRWCHRGVIARTGQHGGRFTMEFRLTAAGVPALPAAPALAPPAGPRRRPWTARGRAAGAARRRPALMLPSCEAGFHARRRV